MNIRSIAVISCKHRQRVFLKTLITGGRIAAWFCPLAISLPLAAKPVECLIEPSQAIEIKSPIEGLIERVTVDRGDSVKKDQILIGLDVGVERARYEQARYKSTMRGAQQAAQSRLDFTSKKFERDHELHKDQYVSANTLDQSESGKKEAAADLLAARDNNKVSELEVREYEELIRLKTLKSPFDGVVVDRLKHPGEVAEPTDHTPILKLAKIQPLFVEVVLPASALGKLQVGEVYQVTPQTEGLPAFSAKVTVLDPVLDAASGTWGVRLETPNQDRKIPAGISCQIDIPNL